MTDIATNLNTIDDSLSDIKTSIVNKGGTVSGNITTFATAINGITPLNGETVNITPSTSAQTITPTSPANGITQANVSAVTSSIDANILAGNIKDGVTILGVTGNYTGSGGASNGKLWVLVPTTDANLNYLSSFMVGDTDYKQDILDQIADIVMPPETGYYECYITLPLGSSYYYRINGSFGYRPKYSPDWGTVDFTNDVSNILYLALFESIS